MDDRSDSPLACGMDESLILDIYEQLEKVLSPFAFDHKIIDVIDLSYGSMNYITNNAAKLLIDEMNKIQNCLSHCKI